MTVQLKINLVMLQHAAAMSVKESELFDQTDNEDDSPLTLLSLSSTLNDAVAPSTTSAPGATLMARETVEKTASKVIHSVFLIEKILTSLHALDSLEPQNLESLFKDSGR